METETPVFTALNTLRASRFTVWLAKIFGQKRVAHDSGCSVTMHKWRGKWYLTNCKDEVPNVQGEPPRAASSREVGSTDGLGVAVQPAPTFEETK